MGHMSGALWAAAVGAGAALLVVAVLYGLG